VSAPADQELRDGRLHERAAVLLAADVVSGRLSSGSAFPSVDQVVQRLQVSRTVAREALQTLAMVGLVRVQHGKRTEVLPPEEWNVLTPIVQQALRREDRLEPIWRDLYDFRRLIEPKAAAWMAERGSEADLERLSTLADEMQELAAEPHNALRVMEADRAFHRLIARAGTNRVLGAVSRSFWEAVSFLWLESELGSEEFADVVEQHHRIAQSINSRDAAAAAAAMDDHLEAASKMDLGRFAARR
jgi:DNA-binding FadR family transcriptional regulator